MDELSEGHSEGNKSVPESNKKRILVKSPAQIEALELFYEAHKYPKDFVKAEFGRSVGLTQKQVSEWFCSRRSKDKKLLNGEVHRNGRQDSFSGTIADHGSGLKQDSCGSTKQGGDRNFEAREVESQQLISQEHASADNNYEFGGRFTGEDGRVDESDDSDMTSGSSSSLLNEPMHRERYPLAMASTRSQTISTDVEMTGVRARKGPSGYLKVKGQLEHPAIIAVKKQMGCNYRVDGPPIAVIFDPLPLGAFDETPKREEPIGSYHIEKSSPPGTFDASISYKNHYLGLASGHNLKKGSRNSDADRRRIQTQSASVDTELCIQPRLKRKSPILNNENESFLRKSLVMDMHEGSMIDAPVYESRYPFEKAKHGVGRMMLDSRSGHRHFSPYNVRVNNVQAETELHNYNSRQMKVVHEEDFHKSYRSVHGQQKGSSKRMTKEVKLFGERIGAHDNYGSAQTKGLHKDEITTSDLASYRANIGPPQPQYRKVSPDDTPSWTTPTNRFPSRPATNMPIQI